ncbi:MAG: alpha/beta hydrolase, partial [Glaciihabitans sp.]
SEIQSLNRQEDAAERDEKELGYSTWSAEIAAYGVSDRVAALRDNLRTAEEMCASAPRGLTGGNAHELPMFDLTGGLHLAPSTGVPIWASQSDLFSERVGDKVLTTLDQLAGMSEAEARAWIAAHPEFDDAALAAPPPADEVATWWFEQGASADLASAGQLALIAVAPAVVGSMEGVGYWARDRSNRAVLDKAIEDERARLEDAQPRARVRLNHDKLDNLLEIQASLDPGDNDQIRQLTSLDLRGRPIAAVSVGDLDAASHVAYQVSGMFSSTSGMTGAVSDAQRLYSEQATVAGRLGRTDPMATVAWIGYDSPDAVSVVFDDKAEAGAEQLSMALTGSNAVGAVQGRDNYLAVDAHSYGTTVSMIALREDLGVDAFAMYGSAGGVDIKDVRELDVPTGEVYATETRNDPWAPVGRFLSDRSDPLSDRFGASEFRSDGGVPDPYGGEFIEISGHSEYLHARSESLRNLALINLGRGDLVTKD